VLKERYGAELTRATALLKDSPPLERARKAFEQVLQDPPLTILFLANFRGAGGGVHSIIQESSGLRKLGVGVQVAIRARDHEFYQDQYPGIPSQLFYVYASDHQLACHARGFQAVVATYFNGVRILQGILKIAPDVTPCYYIQDYEPLFFQPEDPRYAEATESYTLIPEIRCFAKTQWLCDTVWANHKVHVHKVRPSINREFYFADASPKPGVPFIICAMVRPKTPRRSPQLTFEVLRMLKLAYQSKVEIHIFGVDSEDEFFTDQPKDFTYLTLGVLKREEVGALLRKSSLFIDASSYQAFGRTGLEAMACRCATVLPKGCGTSEYAIDGVNTILVESTRAEVVFAAARRYLDSKHFYSSVIEAGVRCASAYSVEDACRSELKFFEAHLKASAPQAKNEELL
jgi:glycosyltransferase involved in cell wall biosynthesis